MIERPVYAFLHIMHDSILCFGDIFPHSIFLKAFCHNLREISFLRFFHIYFPLFIFALEYNEIQAAR